MTYSMDKVLRYGLMEFSTKVNTTKERSTEKANSLGRMGVPTTGSFRTT